MTICRSPPIGYVGAGLACAATSTLAMLVPDQLAPSNLMLVYVLTVVISSVRWGRGPGLFAALLAVACYNFFLVPPRFSFSVAHGQSWITLAVMLVVSLLIGHLTTRLREKTAEAEARAAEASQLHELAFRLAGAGSIDEVEAETERVLGAPAAGWRAPGFKAAVAVVASTVRERIRLVETAHAQSSEIRCERLRTSLLSALSHDLRTPLTVLFGHLDALAQREDLPAASLATLVMLRGEAHRLHRQVENLLDLARLQSGAIHLRRDWQSVPDMIGACVRVMAPWLGDHAVELRLPSDLPLVAVDAVLMDRVFHNLLENAAKYATPGTPLEITATVLEGLAPRLGLAFSNRGDGFPPERLEAVFQLFERGSDASAVPGTGVGLGVCRSIVEAHGGEIAARNVPGGCVVELMLPLAEAPPIPWEDDTVTAHG